MKWDNFFFRQAWLYASMSKDESTQCGAVIVDPTTRSIVAGGFNGPPRMLNDDEYTHLPRPGKYMVFEHAERNAIFNAARSGASLCGCSLYVVPFGLCADCARACIQSGIEVVNVIEGLRPKKEWRESFLTAEKMLHDAGIPIQKFSPNAIIREICPHGPYNIEYTCFGFTGELKKVGGTMLLAQIIIEDIQRANREAGRLLTNF
jgi:dCMP deaminase